MFSSIFVDRPRLAVVIALVTAIAGLVSLLAIPIAQFPNIVPPQVSVTASYPGASSEVVDTTVAQVIESQVIGVDQMIYMSPWWRSLQKATTPQLLPAGAISCSSLARPRSLSL